MSKCPSDIKLALFSQGGLPAGEADTIRRHIVSCPACSDALSSALQVDDLDALGLLPKVTPAEQSVARASLGKAHLPDARGRQHTQETHPEALPHTKDGNVIDLFFGGAMAAGLAAAVMPSDALAGIENKNEIPVRNPPADDSLISGKESDMKEINNGIGMQAAIDSVFNAGVETGIPAPDRIGMQGMSEIVSADVLQDYTDTCAIRCQELVLNDFGQQVSHDQLVQEARMHGWYMPGVGTFEDDLGKLLESHGLSVQRYENANIFNLVSELAQGHRVIITVDSGELWNSSDILRPVAELNAEIWEDWRPDHAVIVSGVDVSDPDNPLVIVTDPGTGQVAASYPLDAFLDAWEDSGFSMIATTQAPEQFGSDHLAWIGEVPYDQFASWYPSVADMTGHESGFDALCSRFANLLHNPLAPGLTLVAFMTDQEMLPDPGSAGQLPAIGNLADSDNDDDDDDFG